MEQISELKAYIQNAKSIVFFGGAGVSTESDIPDFRSAGGLYKTQHKYAPETILSKKFFNEHPEEFFDFYKNNMVYTGATPNAAHYALAKLEAMGKLKAVITQNIDGLHQIAGSNNVYELHGSIHRNYCQGCRKEYPLYYVLEQSGIPRCEECGGIVKPAVILYEEKLDNATLNMSIDYVMNADLIIVGGTSLSVFPAAGILNYYRGNKLVLINRDETHADGRAALVIREKIGKVLAEAVL